MGYVWQFIFQYNHGALNDLVALFGVEKQTWLGNIDSAVYIVTLVNIFQFTGTTMIIYLAGLQTIPKQLKEAAGLDARNELQIFRYVTLPLLMPSITVTSVLNIIGGLKLFDIIVSLTKGGPGYATQSLSTMMYSLYFSRTDAGGAAALGVFMFVLIGIIGVATLKFFRSKEVEL
jgi:raffinose/stachyose/melibiose transport system permease protein